MRTRRPSASAAANLLVDGLVAGYGGSQVLFEASLSVDPGQITVLLGRNGVGKSTLVRSVAGLLGTRSGRLTLCGQDVTGCTAHEMALRGLSVLSQGRRVFPSLTVSENLGLGEMTRRLRERRGVDVGSHWPMDRVLELFPVFASRMRTRAGALSGGEQQSLSLARAMISGPRLLILDEPSEALSPARVQELSGLLSALRAEGMPILLVEQNIDLAYELADSAYAMDKGSIVLRLERKELAGARARLEDLLTI